MAYQCEERLIHKPGKACRCKRRTRGHAGPHECEHRVAWPLEDVLRREEERRQRALAKASEVNEGR